MYFSSTFVKISSLFVIVFGTPQDTFSFINIEDNLCISHQHLLRLTACANLFWI